MPFSIGFFLGIGQSGSGGSPVPPSGNASYLLLESGDHVLLEDGDKILLESAYASLKLESGDYLLLEDDGKILFE